MLTGVIINPQSSLGYHHAGLCLAHNTVSEDGGGDLLLATTQGSMSLYSSGSAILQGFLTHRIISSQLSGRVGNALEEEEKF